MLFKHMPHYRYSISSKLPCNSYDGGVIQSIAFNEHDWIVALILHMRRIDFHVD